MFRQFKISIILLAIILSAVFFTACKSDNPIPIASETPIPATPSPTPAAKIKKGGSISISLLTPDTLNPINTKRWDTYAFTKIFYRELFSLNNELQPVPDLIDSYVSESNDTVWIFKLKDNLTWSDGSPVTAEDAVYTINLIKSGVSNPLLKSVTAGLSTLEETDITSDDNLSFYLQFESTVRWPESILTIPLLPSHILKDEGSIDDIPIGTGPYMIVSKDEETGSLSLIRNPYYSGQSANLDSITVHIHNSYEDMSKAIETGMIDAFLTDSIYNNIYSDVFSHLKRTALNTMEMEYLSINPNSELFKDIQLRRTIYWAIDRKDIIKQAYLFNATISDLPINPASWLYTKDIEAGDYAPDRAAEYIEYSGLFPENKDGEEYDIAPVRIITNSDNKERMEAARLIARMLEKRGFKVKVEYYSWNYMVEKILKRGNYDIYLGGMQLDWRPDINRLYDGSSFTMTASSKNHKVNLFGETNPANEFNLTSLSTASDAENIKMASHDIGMLHSDNLPFLPLYFRDNSLIYHDRIGGIQSGYYVDVYKGIEDWFLWE